MERGSWSELSGDSEIWKKLAIGSVCALLFLPVPVAAGALVADLEAELERIKAKQPPGKLVSMSDIAGLLGKGVAPTFILILVVMAFCLPTVVVGMSYFQNVGWFRGESGINIFSFLLTNVFGLLALGLQFFVALTFPIAAAQYARGMNIKPAIDPLANIGFAFEMGSKYWFKATGFWLALCANIVLFVVSPAFWIDLLIRFVVTGLGFASLVVASRYALNLLQTKL